MPERAQSDKRREMETYRRLHLDRESKSFVRRRSAERGRIYLFIGDKFTDRPWLKVLRADYERQWKHAAQKIYAQIPPDAPQEVLDFCKLKIEHDVYDSLASRSAFLARLDAEFLKQNGRRMTPHEKSVYISTADNVDETLPASTPTARAASQRKRLLEGIVQKIEDIHRHRPQNLQQAWAQVVGEEMAQETLLEKVDTQSGMAYCRCLNPATRFKIQKIRDLPKTLAKLLGMNVRRILFR